MRLSYTLILSAFLPLCRQVVSFVHHQSLSLSSTGSSIEHAQRLVELSGKVSSRAPPTSRGSGHDTHCQIPRRQKVTRTRATVQDLEVVALVAGQENNGLALVCVGEALWSFVQAPSVSQIKVLLPAALAAVVLFAVSGPMIASNDAAAVATGLWIATAASVGLGVSYVARLLAPYSPSPKEAAALGLVVAVAGFFSFSQNLVVDGFVALPTLPSLPSLPEITLNLDLGI
jgi:hypothetical protein